jgi:hypothetical protein
MRGYSVLHANTQPAKMAELSLCSPAAAVSPPQQLFPRGLSRWRLSAAAETVCTRSPGQLHTLGRQYNRFISDKKM